MWVRLVREFSVMIDCRADSDDEVAAQTQKAMRWWALAGRRWRPNDRAHHLPWRRASSSSSILGDDRGTCLYTLLGLDPRGDATLAQVKSAFKRRARAVHPDAAGVNRVAPGPDADDATDAFVRVVAAYEILSCERRRAAYDATRRSPSFMRGASASSSSSSSSSGSHGFAASPFADSEVLRDYAASIDALVPRWKLRDELYGALAHVIHGAELDVEDVHAGDSFPRYFEAEERTLRTFITENTGTTTTRGVDLMHVVAGRTLLAAVREHTDAELTDGREAVAGLLDSYNDDKDDEDGSKREEGRVDAADNATTMATDGRPDARLELVVGGRVVATATRSVRGGDVVVRDSAFCIDSSLGTEPNANATSSARPEASLLKADVNNWGGHPRAGTKANPGNAELIVDAYAARGAGGEVFRISGLSGSFDKATVYDAEGTPRHLVVAHATPGVTHLHWFDARTGICVGRGTRAWVPPADFWLVAPRSDGHDSGGWYFELPPGAPDIHEVDESSGRIEAGPSGFGGRGGRRHVFDEFMEDFERGFGFGGKAEAGDEEKARGRKRVGAPLPPAAALFTTAFRLLDRERGEDHGVGGVVRRAWTGVFGSRY